MRRCICFFIAMVFLIGFVPASVYADSATKSLADSSEPLSEIIFKWNEPQTFLFGLIAIEFDDDETSPYGQYSLEIAAKYTTIEGLLSIVSTDLKDLGLEDLIWTIKHVQKEGTHKSIDGFDLYTLDIWTNGTTYTLVLSDDDLVYIGLYSTKKIGITDCYDRIIDDNNAEYLKVSNTIVLENTLRKTSEEMKEYLTLGEEDRYNAAVDLYHQGFFVDAGTLFESLENYGSSHVYHYLCLAHAMPYDELPRDITRVLDKNRDFEDAPDMLNRVYYERVIALIDNSSYIVARKIIKSHLGDDKYPELVNYLDQVLYDSAVEKYSTGDLDDWFEAKDIFTMLYSYDSYKDTEKWSALCRTVDSNIDSEDYKFLFENLDFQNSKEIILRVDPYLDMFLNGEWRSSDGTSYLIITISEYDKRSLPVSAQYNYNLPYLELENSCIDNTDGILSLCNDTTEKKLYRISIVEDYIIDVYCYKNGSTYRLYRQ